jgi:hypothetical protein
MDLRVIFGYTNRDMKLLYLETVVHFDDGDLVVDMELLANELPIVAHGFACHGDSRQYHTICARNNSTIRLSEY